MSEKNRWFHVRVHNWDATGIAVNSSWFVFNKLITNGLKCCRHHWFLSCHKIPACAGTKIDSEKYSSSWKNMKIFSRQRCTQSVVTEASLGAQRKNRQSSFQAWFAIFLFYSSWKLNGTSVSRTEGRKERGNAWKLWSHRNPQICRTVWPLCCYRCGTDAHQLTLKSHANEMVMNYQKPHPLGSFVRIR